MTTERKDDRSPVLPQWPDALARVVWILLSLSVLSVAYCFVAKRLLGGSLSHYFPLSPREIRFSDFWIYREKFRQFHTAAFFQIGFPFTYPAPVALVYELFFRLAQPHAVRAFVTFSVAAFVLPAAGFARVLSRRLATGPAWLFSLVLLLTSWPATIVTDRGNMEVLVWLVLLLAIWAFYHHHGTTAAALFGVAAALKLFPFVFLGLFLSTRAYRKLAIGIASFAVVSLVSLALLGPTVAVAYHGIASGLLFFKTFYMAQWHTQENGVDHSIFALIKWALILHGHGTKDFSRPLSIYLAVTALAGLVLYFLRIRLLPLTNQVLVYVIVSIWLTAFSGDGTLLHLYYPFALLLLLAIDAARAGRAVRGLGAALLLLAVLVAPISFLNFPQQRIEGEVKCLLLGALLVLALRYPFGPPLAETTRTLDTTDSSSANGHA